MASELPIDAAIAAIAVIVALTLVLFLYAIGLRFAHVMRERWRRRHRALWWPVLAEAAVAPDLDDVAAVRRLKTGSRFEVLREWCRFRSMIRGDEGTALSTLAEELGLQKVARRLLSRPSVSRRLVALQALGFLRDAASREPIEALLDHSNVALSITAAGAIVRIDPEPGIRKVLPMVAGRLDWPRTEVGRILRSAGPEIVSGPLCRAIESANVHDAIYLLQFYESAFVQDVDTVAERLIATRTEPALVTAAMKAVRGHLPTALLEKLTRDDAWYVRMQAATLLGRTGRREDYRLLEPMLSDPEWWVRYRAAQAIAGLPFLGPNALRKLRGRQDDPYAGDILSQVMAEAGLA